MLLLGDPPLLPHEDQSREEKKHARGSHMISGFGDLPAGSSAQYAETPGQMEWVGQRCANVKLAPHKNVNGNGIEVTNLAFPDRWFPNKGLKRER
eukprot:1976138-Amphidinium_carterae.1